MKKFLALSLSGLMLSSVAYAADMVTADQPEQPKLLATWINDQSLSLNDIVKKADDFDKNMNPDEGITCISKTANGYNRLVHPNPEKNKNSATFTDEENKLVAKIFTDVNGKTRTEGVPVAYSVKKMNKEGMAYLVDKDTFCMAYWLAAVPQTSETL
jgi:opacity protein-like surface antigen